MKTTLKYLGISFAMSLAFVGIILLMVVFMTNTCKAQNYCPNESKKVPDCQCTTIQGQIVPFGNGILWVAGFTTGYLGDVAPYWVQVSGQPVVINSTTNPLNPFITGIMPNNTYVFQLRVKCRNGGIVTSNCTVVIEPKQAKILLYK